MVLDRIDGLIIIGKFFAWPVRAYDSQLVAEFDERMKQYVKANFAVEDSNELLAETLPKGEPGLVGIITDKNSSVKDNHRKDEHSRLDNRGAVRDPMGIRSNGQFC